MRTLCLTAVALLLLSSAYADSGGALDARKYAVQVDDGKETVTDEFVFSAGSFKSVAAAQNGFKAAPYQASEKDGAISFTVVSKNEDFGDMTWKGKVTGDKIEGTAVWNKGFWHFDKKYEFKGAQELQ